LERDWLLINSIAIIEAVIVLAVIGVISLKSKLLDLSGIIASFIVGFLIIVFGGWTWFIILMIFYAMAMGATKFRHEQSGRKKSWMNDLTRTWCNVAANGGVPALFALAEGFMPLTIFTAGFIGAISTATSDTLATEIGLLYPHRPRLITNLKKAVPAGTSGAISPWGEGAIVFGACAIALAAGGFGIFSWPFTKVVALVLIAGIIGSTIDSILGATVQANYKCSRCGKITENRVHCGKPAKYMKGIRVIDNNVVNFMGSLTGAIVAMLLASFL